MQDLREMIKARDSLDAARQKMLSLFHKADLDSGGVSVSDYELRDAMRAASVRSVAAKDWLARDLDGDLAVTRTELEAYFDEKARRPTWTSEQKAVSPTEEEIRRERDRLVREALAIDRDGDEVVSIAEMQASADTRLAGLPPLPRPIPLDMDRDGDSVVTKAEFLLAVDTILAGIDSDGDGIISSAEGAAFAGVAVEHWEGAEDVRAEEAMFRKKVESCALPEPPDDAVVFLLNVSHGRALSTVSIGGDEEEVTVIEIRIEPGDEPLYVLLNSSEAVIWRFFGAVDRVVNAVASSSDRDKRNRMRAGVTGLDRDRVHFLRGGGCLSGFGTRYPEKPGRYEDPLLQRLIGRAVDVAAISPTPVAVSAPSGRVSKDFDNADKVKLPGRGASAPVWKSMLRFYPGGLIRIDPESVVANAPVRRYDVLPQQAGLAQLVEEGALEPVPGPGGFSPVLGTFRIVKKMRFPPGLYGAHSVTFVLAPDVPTPEGNPGHSRVTRQGGTP